MYQGSRLGVTAVPSTLPSVGPVSGINWQDVISQVINTAGQIIKPSAYPSYSTYSPTGAAAVGIANSPAIWLLGGVVAAALLLKRR